MLIRASVRSIDTHYCDCYLHRDIFKSKKLAGTMSAHSVRLLKSIQSSLTRSLTQLVKQMLMHNMVAVNICSGRVRPNIAEKAE